MRAAAIATPGWADVGCVDLALGRNAESVFLQIPFILPWVKAKTVALDSMATYFPQQRTDNFL